MKLDKIKGAEIRRTEIVLVNFISIDKVRGAFSLGGTLWDYLKNIFLSRQ